MKAKHKKLIFKGLKILIPLAITGIILLFLTFRVKEFFGEAGYFNVKKVLIMGNGKLDLAKDADLNNLVGENIFNVDLRSVAFRILQKYPGIKEAQVMRKLPNQLMVKIKMRQPLMQLKLNKYFLVDKDMVVLPAPLDEPDADLIIITGLENRLSGTIGRQLLLKETTTALSLINALKNTNILKDYQVREINVSRLTDTFLLLMLKSNSGTQVMPQNLIQVKIGNEDFENRLMVLTQLLASVRPNLDKVKYIDLRFKEPVVGQGVE